MKNLNVCSYEFGVTKLFWLKSILVFQFDVTID